MTAPKICLCLTGSSLEENLQILEKYRNWIDMAELRVDHLTNDERLHIRKFPALAGIPTVLTIRRVIDGGSFREGEASRTMLFARGLAFADQDSRKNFAYVDFETDFHVPSLQDAAFAFGTRIIRSIHDMEHMATDIAARFKQMRITGYEIPKIACMPSSLSDVTRMFREAKELTDSEHILCAMGPYGLPTRILASRLGSYLTYVSPEETADKVSGLGHIDPVSINTMYNFHGINERTQIFGITGYPLEITRSPDFHNHGYRIHGMNSVYIPLRAKHAEEAVEFANETGMRGLSVTIPHKERVTDGIELFSPEAVAVGSCNTLVKENGSWKGYNTDAQGLIYALRDFLGTQNLARKKVAIIGAGGSARAAAYAVKTMKGKACIFNRTPAKARSIADSYGFKWAALDENSLPLLEKYSRIIIQTTSVGMGSNEQVNEENDPLFFYDFNGSEVIYDIIYAPEITPVMARAQQAGCRVSNGYSMFKYQALMQFELFTGEQYDKDRPSGTAEKYGRSVRR